MEFRWNLKKTAANLKKHGVSFEEARTALRDPLSITGFDPDHSEAEDRWLTFRISDQGRLLAVAHTEQGDDIGIISARTATNVERALYEEG